MSKFNEYISSLDGKELDPVVIASTLLELHNEEMGLASSKIASLETDIAGRDGKITELSDSLREQKSINWDLVQRVPAGDKGVDAQTTDDEIDASNATFDDFFEEGN